MKKFVSVILALTMVLGLTACGGNTEQETTVPAAKDETTVPAATEQTTAPAAEAPASALEILETVWADYAEDEKFPVIGGSMAAPVDGAPGSYDIADENITYNLLIPAEQLANVTEAASMIHMMNANTFTCGVFKLADGVAAEDFGAAMKDAVLNNQWMCGFPETLLIKNIGDAYVLVAFGVNDAVNPFETHFSAVYPDAQTLVNEPIA